MKKNLLIISDTTTTVHDIRSVLHHTDLINVSQVTEGSSAYRSIRELKPDMLLVNLETPGLATSWTAMQLDGLEITRKIPVVATTGIMAWEEMEILSDMTGARILPDSVPNTQLGAIIKSALLQ